MLSLMDNLHQLIKDMPKAELHVHLEGSVRGETLQQLASRHAGIVSDSLAVEMNSLFDTRQYSGFYEFGRKFGLVQQMLRTPEDFELAVHEFGREMAAQNVHYSEVIIAPYTHTHVQNKGLEIDDILEGLNKGRRRAQVDFGVEMRWVFGFSRNLCVTSEGEIDLSPAETTLAYAITGKHYGVVGLTVGGDESSCAPEIFAPVFSIARQSGLLALPHAGETAGPSSVRTAVLNLGADRIGHGVRAVEDLAVLELLRERRIPLDISLTSNQAIQLYPELRRHPLPILLGEGLTLTINSDDPALFNTSLTREYQLLSSVFHYDLTTIAGLARNAFNVCGAEHQLKQRLLAEFDHWESVFVDENRIK